MLKALIPDLYLPSLLHLDLQKLRVRDIKGIICDMDNTILSWEAERVDDPMAAWCKQARERGFEICLVSNGMKRRVALVAEDLGLPYVARAVKPRLEPFHRALRILGLSSQEVAVIGDQIFTDVWGGNRMGMFTILVDPLSSKEMLNTRFVRFVEGFIRRRLTRENNV